jgi:hypothetical protein
VGAAAVRRRSALVVVWWSSARLQAVPWVQNVFRCCDAKGLAAETRATACSNFIEGLLQRHGRAQAGKPPSCRETPPWRPTRRKTKCWIRRRRSDPRASIHVWRLLLLLLLLPALFILLPLSYAGSKVDFYLA